METFDIGVFSDTDSDEDFEPSKTTTKQSPNFVDQELINRTRPTKNLGSRPKKDNDDFHLECPPPPKVHIPSDRSDVPGPRVISRPRSTKRTTVTASMPPDEAPYNKLSRLPQPGSKYRLFNTLFQQVEAESDISADEESLCDFSSGSEDYIYIPDSEESEVSDEDTDDAEEPIPKNVVKSKRPHPEKTFPYSNSAKKKRIFSKSKPLNPPQEGEDQGHSPENFWVRVYPPEPVVDISTEFTVNNPGPTCTRSESPLHYFFLFFTDTWWNLLVTETNKYARAKLAELRRSKVLTPQSRFQRWVNVSVEEMKKYIGLLLSMVLNRRKDLIQYWSKNPVLEIPLYAKTMSLKRFQIITTMLHLSSRVSPRRGQPGHDPWVKLREFIDLMNQSFKSNFIPDQQVYIDESLIGMKNRSAFIQSKPNKRHSNFGIKKFELYDCQTGYVLQSVLYTSKYFLADESDPFTHKVVGFLMNEVGLLNKGYHLFTDSFYTNIPLASFLLSQNTFLTGTFNKQSKELSKITSQAKLSVGESLYYRSEIEPSGSVLLVKYKERQTRKPVHLISTASYAQDKEVTSKRGHVVVKPVMIQTFKTYMGGVDSKDKNVYHVSSSRATKKYWRKIVYNFIDIAVSNAFVLYSFHNPTGKSRYNFINDVIVHLCCVSMPPLAMPIADLEGDQPNPHQLVRLPGNNSRFCVVCLEQGRKKRSIYCCKECNVGLHEICEGNFNHTGPRRRSGRPALLPSQ